MGEPITIKEAAYRAKVCYLTVWRWINKGTIKTSQPGGRKGQHYISEDEFNRVFKGAK